MRLERSLLRIVTVWEEIRRAPANRPGDPRVTVRTNATNVMGLTISCPLDWLELENIYKNMIQ